MRNNKLKKFLAVIINISIIMMELYAFIVCLKNDGISCFKYYTQDSNLFLMFASIIYTIYAITDKDDKQSPHWITLLKYSATVCVSTTFLVVITILAPIMGGYKVMVIDGTMKFHHLICPILALITFIFLEKHELNVKKDALLAMIFTVAYGIVAVSLNIFKIMDGPYPFLKVYEQSLLMSIMWVILMNGSTYLLNISIGYLNNYLNKKQ